MKKLVIGFALTAVLTISGQSIALAAGPSCYEKDALCKEFASLTEAEQYDRIIAKIDTKTAYSEEAKAFIGQAYLAIAGRETNTPEQEEQFCLKALEYGATSAYMGLYFIHAGQNEEKAIGFLRQYIMTSPKDSVPYVLMGEYELSKQNYEDANLYLREAKRVARGHSTNLDWMLFQVSYLLGDYTYASTMLDSALAQGQFVNELRSLSADPRFADLSKRPEFRKHMPIIKGTKAMASN